MTEASSTVPTSGKIDEKAGVHIFPVRVYYEDTDAAGIVYYVNYLKFAERARTELLRLYGRNQAVMWAEDGVGFSVRSCMVDYLSPARLDNSLEVHTSLVDIGGASMRLRQRLFRDQVLLADMRFRLAVMDLSGRPARMPKDLRDALEPHANPNDA